MGSSGNKDDHGKLIFGWRWVWGDSRIGSHSFGIALGLYGLGGGGWNIDSHWCRLKLGGIDEDGMIRERGW